MSCNNRLIDNQLSGAKEFKAAITWLTCSDLHLSSGVRRKSVERSFLGARLTSRGSVLKERLWTAQATV